MSGPLRLALDARLLRGGGIGRFVREVGSRWLAHPEVAEVRFLGRPKELEAWLEELEADRASRARVVPWKGRPYSLGAQLWWGLRVAPRLQDADGVLFPHYDAPLLRHPGASVLVVHDLTHYLRPGDFSAPKRWAGRWLLRGALRRAGRVATVSETSREELVRWRPPVEEKLSVVPNGVSELFRPLEEDPGGVRSRWAVHRPFLLAVGPDKPHKNLGLAVEVLARLRRRPLGRGPGGAPPPEDARPAPPNLRLLVAGADAGSGGPLARRARDLEVGDAVVPLGRLDDESLREAYATAELLLFPSLREGFGLPPLEAMACGTPALVSRRSSLPEVVGDAAPLLDPERPEAWEAAARRLLAGGAERERWVRKGLRRARRYSWDETACSLLQLLGEAARGGDPSTAPAGRAPASPLDL